MRTDDWFLTAAERGNPATAIDRRQRGIGTTGEAWTSGNDVQVLIDGAGYFACLLDEAARCAAGDRVLLTDLEGDGDERLAGPGTEVTNVFADLARRGVEVFGLLWRSHPAGPNRGQLDNAELARGVNEAGGHVVLDNRIRRGGSHHQKIVVFEKPDRPDRDHDVAFCGGIDLARGRNDGPEHVGDPQAAPLDDPRYGEHPPWHDVQAELRGPAVADIAWTFRERWDDPTPLDRPSPWRRWLKARAREPAHRDRIRNDQRVARPRGPHLVQVLRTYPAKRPPSPFAPDGERSIAKAYLKAFARARALVYIEDQYLWASDATRALRAALRREPALRVVVVIPRYPDPSGSVVGGASRYGREAALRDLAAGGDHRVLVLDLENGYGTPIYVHSKICIVDDVWMAVGSDNLNRRSWTHDSEISCAILDTTVDERAPRDPGGLGDQARKLPRDTRLRLAREHLGLDESEADELIDPAAFFAAAHARAERLDAWYASGRDGPRPPGHVRLHVPEHVSRGLRPLFHRVHSATLDPDGRPRDMRGDGY